MSENRPTVRTGHRPPAVSSQPFPAVDEREARLAEMAHPANRPTVRRPPAGLDVTETDPAATLGAGEPTRIARPGVEVPHLGDGTGQGEDGRATAPVPGQGAGGGGRETAPYQPTRPVGAGVGQTDSPWSRFVVQDAVDLPAGIFEQPWQSPRLFGTPPFASTAGTALTLPNVSIDSKTVVQTGTITVGAVLLFLATEAMGAVASAVSAFIPRSLLDAMNRPRTPDEA